MAAGIADQRSGTHSGRIFSFVKIVDDSDKEHISGIVSV